MKNSKRTYSSITNLMAIVFSAVLAVAIIIIVYLGVQKSSIKKSPNKSAPEQTEKVIGNETKQLYSLKGVAIRLNSPDTSKRLTSPVTIKGEVPGSWSFEASFPVILTDLNDRVIAQAPARLNGDWMTESYAPFEVTLSFSNTAYETKGYIILKKDNPSDLPANEDYLKIPVVY